jgi:hypothetical protein
MRGRPRAQPAQVTRQRRRRGNLAHVPERTAQGASVRQSAVRGSGQPVLDERLGLRDAHPLDRHRHYDAGEARSRLTNHQRVHRPGGPAELGGKLGQARRDGGGRRIASKLGAEFRIDQQPLDQLARALVLPISG